MTRSIQRFFCFAAAIATGVLFFSLWSAKVQAFSGGSTYCNSSGNATMCYTPTNTTVFNVPPSTQSNYLSTGKYTCGACPTSPP